MAGFRTIREQMPEAFGPMQPHEMRQAMGSVAPGGFGAMQALVRARNVSQAEHLARQNAMIEMALAKLRSALGGVSKPGAIAEAGATGQLTRPWPGIYKGTIEKGRTVPKSYTSPRTYDLSEFE